MDSGNPDWIKFDELKTKLLETKSLFTPLSADTAGQLPIVQQAWPKFSGKKVRNPTV